MAEWTYVVADLMTGAAMAELPLTGAAPSKALGASGQCSGSFLVSDVLRGDPYSLTTPARTALYVYRDARAYWGGIIWTRRYDSASGRLELGAADWWSYFDHRKVLPVLGGAPTVHTVAGLSVSYTGTDQNAIARQLVALAQAHTGGDLGIVVDTADSGTLRDRTYLGYELSDVGEALRQLSSLDGGPDMMFDVGGPDASGRPVRLLRLGTPTLGQPDSPHVFEYGGNLLSYVWPSDGSRMATRAFAVGEGQEAGQLVAVAEDTTRYDDGWPLLEAEEGYTTVSVGATLTAHAVEDQRAARLPVVLPAITVSGDALGYVQPGDDARVIIRDGFLRQGVDTRMRVIGVEPSAPGTEPDTAVLTLSPLSEDVA